MNKIHRTVWNEARQCYVVASETAKAKGKASSARTGVVPAVAAALLALSAGHGLAAVTDICTTTPTTAISGAITGTNQCLLGNGEGVSISGTGSIVVNATVQTDVPIRVAPGVTAAGSIVNSGSITNTGSGNPAVNIRGVADSIFNAGTIQGAASAVYMSNSSIANGVTNAGLLRANYPLYMSSNSTIVGGLTNTGTMIGTIDGVDFNYNVLLSNGFTNSGSISGGNYGIRVVSTSNLSGGLTNSGTISGITAGIRIAQGTWSGGLTNSGTISGTATGATSSIIVATSTTGTAAGTLSGIFIEGSNAKFIGAVSAPNTPATVSTGATYTMDNGQRFTVSGFTNAGTLKVGAGNTGTITGNYTNTGTFSPTVGTTSSFGKLTVSGTATVPANMNIDVVFSDTNACAGLTAAGTVAGIIRAGTLTVTGGTTLSGTVTTNCATALTTLVAKQNGNNIDLVIPGPPNTAPTFVGVTTTLTVAQSAAATDIKSLLHASDSDASQTLTWSQSAAPSHGTLSFGSATASSGSTDVTPGGTITYTPTAGYAGSDSFTVQVSDGTDSATRTITVTVSAPTVTVTALTLNTMTAGTLFVSQSFAGAGGYGAYSYTVSAGTLPAGLALNATTGALTGTPTTAGAYSFTIQATDSSTPTGVSGIRAFTGSVAAANVAPTFVGATTTLTVAQSAAATDIKSLIHASDSDASQTLTWSQSAAPSHGTLSFGSATASSGSTDVTPGGTITYTPTAGYAGADSFTVQVSDGTASATRTISVTVSAPTVTVAALTLNTMTVGTLFVSQSFAGAGGYGAYSYTVSAGTLPAGLALNATTGALTGTPTTAGAYNFTIQATDSSTPTGVSGIRAFTGSVAAANVAPTFVGATTTLTIAQSAAATDIKALLHASDSDASQTLTWSQSAAPSHGTLSFGSATASSGSTDVTPGGTITYTPTAGYAGADAFTVQVSDGTATATRTINVTVTAPTVTVTALTLNSMTVGTAYTSQSFAGAGGYGAYTYSVSTGTLPAGLSLNASTGALTGTPTTAGAYSFTIQAADSSTGTGAPFAGTRAFSGTVAAANVAPTFVGATTTLTVAQSASATDVKGLLHASDSDASQTLTWIQTGTAPAHGTLSITSATAASGSADVTPGGTITYTPTAGYVGSDSFTVQVSDGTASATRAISVTVSAPTVTVGALTLNSMTVGTVFVSQSFVGAGGYGAYAYTVSAGSLPAGLSLNASTGALTGTPTTAGAYSFTIQAVDSSTGTGAPFAGTQAFSGTVAAAAVTATQTNIATLTNGVTAALAASGCSGVNSAVFITAPAGAPSNTTFPFGLLDFRLSGCSGTSVSVTVTYSQNLPANAVFYKELNGTYSTYPTTAIGINSVTFTLTDGGAGDADGLVDGNIHDPSGLGVTAVAAPTSIPTLSEWGLILLSSLLAMVGIRQSRRRNGL